MQTDYVLRIIEQLGAMLAKLTALQRVGQPAEVTQGDVEATTRHGKGRRDRGMASESSKFLRMSLADAG